MDLSFEEWAQCIGTVDAFDPHLRLEELVGTRLDRAEVAARRRRHYADAVAAGIEVLPGVRAWVAEAARRGLPVAIASSSPPAWVERHLRTFGLLDAFAHRSCHDGSCPPKPAPDLYLRAVEALRVDPGATLALEDSPNGARAAHAAGLWCVAVPHDLTRTLDLSAADLVIDSLATTTLAEVEELLRARLSGRDEGRGPLSSRR